MLDHLVFDTTSAATMADSHNVGAYIRASDGTLIAKATINSVDRLAVDSTLKDGAGVALTSTLVGSDQALDVNVVGGVNVEVDLSHTDDSVRLGDGTNFFTSTSENSDIALDVHVSNTSIAVTATNLDIRDLVYTSDSVTAYQGTNPWVIGDGGSSITVDAVNLDIRDLTAASDSVQSWLRDGAGTALTSTLVGSDQALDVNLVNTISINDAALANTAIANDVNVLDTANIAEAIVTSALSNRKYLWIYNNGNRKLYVGGASVTAANGFPVSPGSYLEMRAGASISPYFIGQTGDTPEIRHLELS